MGVMTLADFRDEVRFICGGISATSPAWTDARIDRRINASYLWCSMPNIYRHPELEDIDRIILVANVASYILTEDYYMIYGVDHVEAGFGLATDESRRTKLEPVDVREQMTILRQPSKPSGYSYWNQRIRLNCVPATAYVGQQLELYGYRQPDTLSVVGAVTVLKPEWDEIILVGAEWRMWVTLNEADRAYEAKQNLGAMVNEVADVRRLHGEEWGWQTGSDASSGYMRTV